jgi:hypothetical protein
MSIVCAPDPPKAGEYVTITAMSPGAAKSSTLSVRGALSGEGDGAGSVSFGGTVDKNTPFGSIQATARYKDHQNHTTEETQTFTLAK